MFYFDNIIIENIKFNVWLLLELVFGFGEVVEGVWECMGSDFLLFKDLLCVFFLNIEFEKRGLYCCLCNYFCI